MNIFFRNIDLHQEEFMAELEARILNKIAGQFHTLNNGNIRLGALIMTSIKDLNDAIAAVSAEVSKERTTSAALVLANAALMTANADKDAQIATQAQSIDALNAQVASAASAVDLQGAVDTLNALAVPPAADVAPTV